MGGNGRYEAFGIKARKNPMLKNYFGFLAL
jgi:hypothetical protein